MSGTATGAPNMTLDCGIGCPGGVEQLTSLRAYVHSLADVGLLPDENEIARIGRDLVALLEAARDHGFVYPALTPSNVLIDEGGRVRLTEDIEASARGAPPRSPHDPGDTADAIRALGDVLHFLATGAVPLQPVASKADSGRRITLLNPEIGPGVITVIERCLAADGAERFLDLAQVAAALREGVRADRRGSMCQVSVIGDSEETAQDHARQRAQRLGDTLCALSIQDDDGEGRRWRDPQSPPVQTGDLELTAGAVLALAEITRELGDPTHRAVLIEAAQWVRAALASAPPSVPGLLCAGAALLRTGQVLHDHALIDAAAECGRSVATMPYRSLDLATGNAGRIRLHLWLYDHTDDLSHLEDAIDAGDVLVAMADRMPASGSAWTWPAGNVTIETGYERGVAGIGDALLDLYEATGDTRFLGAARGAADWLATLASPVLADGSGLGWPPRAGEAVRIGHPCDGAPGIARFFLHAARLDLVPDAWSIAIGATHTSAAARRFAGPTLSHGLSGQIDVLLDMYRATEASAWLRSARELAILLDTQAALVEGHLVYGERVKSMSSPAYMDGCGGVAVTLLRLAAPERLPRQLSRDGFRHQSPPARPHPGMRGGDIIV